MAEFNKLNTKEDYRSRRVAMEITLESLPSEKSKKRYQKKIDKLYDIAKEKGWTDEHSN